MPEQLNLRLDDDGKRCLFAIAERIKGHSIDFAWEMAEEMLTESKRREANSND